MKLITDIGAFQSTLKGASRRASNGRPDSYLEDDGEDDDDDDGGSVAKHKAIKAFSGAAMMMMSIM